ncbi:MAG: type II toxin-antitoxin system VapC family toxin [Alphaproteobacteria bacterium]
MDKVYLLDTCAIIWMGNEDQMHDASVLALDQASARREPVYLSPMSAWEIGMLASRGRFTSPLSPLDWFNRFVKTGGFAMTAMDAQMLIDSSFLPGNPPRDPVDRIIIATVRREGLTLITRDKAILEYGEAGHISVLAC